jgi:hypothetical protein
LLLQTEDDTGGLVPPVQQQTMNCFTAETEDEVGAVILDSLPFIMNQSKFKAEKQKEIFPFNSRQIHNAAT